MYWATGTMHLHTPLTHAQHSYCASLYIRSSVQYWSALLYAMHTYLIFKVNWVQVGTNNNLIWVCIKHYTTHDLVILITDVTDKYIG